MHHGLKTQPPEVLTWTTTSLISTIFHSWRQNSMFFSNGGRFGSLFCSRFRVFFHLRKASCSACLNSSAEPTAFQFGFLGMVKNPPSSRSSSSPLSPPPNLFSEAS